MACRSCFLKHVIEGKVEESVEVTGRRGRTRKPLLDDLKEKKMILVIERGSTRSHCVENSLWKGLWSCNKTDYRMSKFLAFCLTNHSDNFFNNACFRHIFVYLFMCVSRLY
jgi:hypothetical protein